MIPMTIIFRTPSDYLADGVASGLIGGVVVAGMMVLALRWIKRRNRMRKVK